MAEAKCEAELSAEQVVERSFGVLRDLLDLSAEDTHDVLALALAVFARILRPGMSAREAAEAQAQTLRLGCEALSEQAVATFAVRLMRDTPRRPPSGPHLRDPMRAPRRWRRPPVARGKRR